MLDLNQVVTGVTLSKVTSIKPDGSSAEHKNINLSVSFEGASLQGVFDKALAGLVIQWQNGPGRKNFDSWTNNQVVEISFKSPGKTTVDPETAMVAKLQSMTAEEQSEFLAELVKKASK